MDTISVCIKHRQDMIRLIADKKQFTTSIVKHVGECKECMDVLHILREEWRGEVSAVDMP